MCWHTFFQCKTSSVWSSSRFRCAFVSKSILHPISPLSHGLPIKKNSPPGSDDPHERIWLCFRICYYLVWGSIYRRICWQRYCHVQEGPLQCFKMSLPPCQLLETRCYRIFVMCCFVGRARTSCVHSVQRQIGNILLWRCLQSFNARAHDLLNKELGEITVW